MEQHGKMTAVDPLASMDPRGTLGFAGKYRLLAKLGHGGMANVFLAVAQGPASFNKLVVIKRLHGDIAESESHITMFLDEAKLSARLSHPNIVHTYEIGDTNGAYYIVMEYLEGQPLNRVARAVAHQEPGAVGFTRGTWVRIVAEILSGLHYAHDLCDYDGSPLNIVHRDISPHNVFITYDGGVKVVDFGIAKATLNTTRTESGVFKGKVYYMAPEQANGSRQLDRRADIFATGIVLWELLTQQRVFSGDAIDTLRRLVSDDSPIPRISTLDPNVPPELDDIAAKALERNPAMRFSTAQEMRQALESYMRSTGEDIRMDELGATMSGAFAERRAMMRRQINTQLEQLGRTDSARPSSAPQLGGVRAPLSMRSASLILPTLDHGGGSSTSGAVPFDDGGLVSLRPTAGPASSLKRGYFIGAAGLVALLVAAVFGLRSPSRETAAESSPTVPPPAQEVGALRITSEPPEAVVSWNGRVLGKTPLKVDLPAGTQTVVVSSPDFFDETLVVILSPAQSLERAVVLRHKEASARAEDPAASTRLPSEGGGARGAPKPSRKAAAPQDTTTSVDPAAAAPPSGSAATPEIRILNDDAKPMVNVKIIR